MRIGGEKGGEKYFLETGIFFARFLVQSGVFKWRM